MTPGQIVAIIVSVIVTSIVVTFSIVSNTPKVIHTDDIDVKDGGTKSRNEDFNELFSLQDIIKSVV